MYVPEQKTFMEKLVQEFCNELTRFELKFLRDVRNRATGLVDSDIDYRRFALALAQSVEAIGETRPYNLHLKAIECNLVTAKYLNNEASRRELNEARANAWVAAGATPHRSSSFIMEAAAFTAMAALNEKIDESDMTRESAKASMRAVLNSGLTTEYKAKWLGQVIDIYIELSLESVNR